MEKIKKLVKEFENSDYTPSSEQDMFERDSDFLEKLIKAIDEEPLMTSKALEIAEQIVKEHRKTVKIPITDFQAEQLIIQGIRKASNEEPFEALEPKRFSPNEEVYKNMTNKKYICIVDDEHMVGSISEIEDWFNSNGFNDDVNDIIMYELKSDISVGCSFEYKTCIKII